MQGILIGIVQTDDGETCIGLRVSENETVALSLPHAADVCEQLAVLLEQAGYTEEAPEEDDLGYPEPEPEGGWLN